MRIDANTKVTKLLISWCAYEYINKLSMVRIRIIYRGQYKI